MVLDLVITIVVSTIVVACGVGAVLVLPWDRAFESSDEPSDYEDERDDCYTR